MFLDSGLLSSNAIDDEQGVDTVIVSVIDKTLLDSRLLPTDAIGVDEGADTVGDGGNGDVTVFKDGPDNDNDVDDDEDDEKDGFVAVIGGDGGGGDDSVVDCSSGVQCM